MFIMVHKVDDPEEFMQYNFIDEEDYIKCYIPIDFINDGNSSIIIDFSQVEEKDKTLNKISNEGYKYEVVL